MRSGVLTSVHSFAADPTRGLFILGFLIIVIGGALTLYAWRAPMLKSPAGFEGTAREAFLLYNNIFLVVAAAMVFVGTLAPLIADALGMHAALGGLALFRQLFPMLMLPLGALVSIGIHAAWKRGQLGNSRRAHPGRVWRRAARRPGAGVRRLRRRQALTPVGLVLGIWIILSSLFDPIDRLRRRLSLPRAIIGMTLAHIGLGVGVIAISTVESYTVERDAAIAPGETLALGRMPTASTASRRSKGLTTTACAPRSRCCAMARRSRRCIPEQRNYWVQRSTLTEAGIASRWNMDLFVALSKDVGGGRWSVRAQLRPFIDWVWLSAGLMALGGVLAVTDRRYRARAAAREPADRAQGSAAEAT